MMVRSFSFNFEMNARGLAAIDPLRTFSLFSFEDQKQSFSDAEVRFAVRVSVVT